MDEREPGESAAEDDEREQAGEAEQVAERAGHHWGSSLAGWAGGPTR